MWKLLWTGLLLTLALYADVTGKCVGTVERTDPAGKANQESIYLQLLQSGTQVTGKIGSEGAQEYEISKGKIDGTTFTFVVEPPGSTPWSFRLAILADTMKGESSATEEGKAVRGRVDLKRQ